MIKITVDLVSARSADRNRRLGYIAIANRGDGSDSKGNYTIAVSKDGRNVREGEVLNFPRKSRSVFELLRRGLNDLHKRKQLP